MKKLITLILLSFSLNGMAQNGFVKTHTVGIEVGLWSRGLAGVSYEYNFLKRKSYFLSLHASVGAGLDLHSTNYFTTFAPSINIGRGTFHFIAGPEAKYIRFGDLIGPFQGGLCTINHKLSFLSVLCEISRQFTLSTRKIKRILYIRNQKNGR